MESAAPEVHLGPRPGEIKPEVYERWIVRLAANNYRSAYVKNDGRQSGNPRSDTTI